MPLLVGCRRTSTAGNKQAIKILCLTISRCRRANVDADETGIGRVVHDLNVIKVVIGHDVRDRRDFVDHDAYVGAGCHVTRGVGKDGQVLEYRVPGLVDFKDRSPAKPYQRRAAFPAPAPPAAPIVACP